MRLFVYLYYLFYILSGGFRHYGFGFLFSKTLAGEQLFTTPFPVTFAEFFLLLFAFIILLFPEKKYLNLLFFAILFLMDLYFQNCVSFMSCFILPHFFPFFFFLFFHFKNDEHKRTMVSYAAMLFVAVGYLSSFTSKGYASWLNPSDTIIYSYILEFYNGFQIPSLVSSALVKVQNQFFWKLVDYSVLAFQASFVLVFINKKYFPYLTIVAVLFHIGILISLGIGVVFYLYILFYGFAIYTSLNKEHYSINFENKNIMTLKNFIVAVLAILFAMSSFNIHFFSNLLPLNFYVFVEYFYMIICIAVFLFSFFSWSKKYALQSSATN